MTLLLSWLLAFCLSATIYLFVRLVWRINRYEHLAEPLFLGLSCLVPMAGAALIAPHLPANNALSGLQMTFLLLGLALGFYHGWRQHKYLQWQTTTPI